MKKYRVNEIFYSLQGEGFYTGTPAVFLRFAGCNRACPFCDTDFKNFTAMDADEIAEAVAAFPARHLVATGGEPLLQLDSDLLRAIKARGFYVQVETNGSMPVPPEVDWVTCSPKDAPWEVNRIDELKIVYQGQDVEQTASLLPAPRLFLQPSAGGDVAATHENIKSKTRGGRSRQNHQQNDIR